ncbi:PREDICTED: WAT1-related protein At2g39510-like [Ipomoea nil]|uniref:WAT1-related protein At2g39510-like n=1 Tax=Ipomoea nil TaxID=35883 RepID=UPI000900C353|nr:PREDICTED: WAT1-related protein At2g39510-like [Ipomoea nil]
MANQPYHIDTTQEKEALGSRKNRSMSNKSLVNLLKQSKPYLAVILLQFGYAGSSIIVKYALDKGVNHYTFVLYANAIAGILFAPFALLFERKRRPKLTPSIFLKIFLLGFLEAVLDQNLFYAGMQYTTATFASALCNILPAITFVLAWILRLENVNIRALHSQAKILGTLVTVGGAMIMTLVKGPKILLPWTQERGHIQSTTAATHQHPIKGAIMITAGCCFWACFFILQAITLRSYPAGLSLTSLICLMGALQCGVLTLAVERSNTAVWALNWDIKLLAIVYNGIICSGVGYYLSGVIMKEKGPFFVSAFNPLSLVIVAIMGSFLLAEQLLLGSVLGACIIAVGLYLVIWSKSDNQDSPVLSNAEEGSSS